MSVRTIAPVRRLRGTIQPPGDKSISHRAAMLNALADGDAVVHNFLPGDDCLSTLDVLRALGVDCDLEMSGDPTVLRVRGAGLHGLREASGVLDCGNSGTTMRLLAGLLFGVSPYDVPTLALVIVVLLATALLASFVPAFPLETEIDPTGAGDSFAGALLGFLAKSGASDSNTLRRALLYATTVASFCVEGVGTNRLEAVTGDHLNARLTELRALTMLEG